MVHPVELENAYLEKERHREPINFWVTMLVFGGVVVLLTSKIDKIDVLMALRSVSQMHLQVSINRAL